MVVFWGPRAKLLPETIQHVHNKCPGGKLCTKTCLGKTVCAQQKAWGSQNQNPKRTQVQDISKDAFVIQPYPTQPGPRLPYHTSSCPTSQNLLVPGPLARPCQTPTKILAQIRLKRIHVSFCGAVGRGGCRPASLVALAKKTEVDELTVRGVQCTERKITQAH